MQQELANENQVRWRWKLWISNWVFHRTPKLHLASLLSTSITFNKMQKAAVHWQTYPFLPFSHVISTWNWGSWQLLEELEHVTYLACLCHAWRTEIPRTKTLQHFPRATLSENVEMLRDAKTSTLRCPKWSVLHHSCLVCKWARTYRASPVMVVIFESCKDPSKPEKHAVICTMILRLAGTLTRAFF